MQLSKQIIADYFLTLGGVGIFVALLGLLISLLVKQFLKKDFERYNQDLMKGLEDHKREITSRLDRERSALQTISNKLLAEHQTRFSLYHQKRADAIADLYSALIDACSRVKTLELVRTKDEFLSAAKDLVELNQRILKSRIYLDEPLVKDISSTLMDFRDLIAEVSKIIDNEDHAFDSAEWQKRLEEGWKQIK